VVEVVVEEEEEEEVLLQYFIMPLGTLLVTKILQENGTLIYTLTFLRF